MSRSDTPYAGLPDHCFWSRSHRDRDLTEIDPVVAGHFRVTQETRIATAGSCFAQHVARYLVDEEFNYFVTETAHPVISPDVARSFNYGTFSARFGNIYTARQLLQLAQRARWWEWNWCEREFGDSQFAPFAAPRDAVAQWRDPLDSPHTSQVDYCAERVE